MGDDSSVARASETSKAKPSRRQRVTAIAVIAVALAVGAMGYAVQAEEEKRHLARVTKLTVLGNLRMIGTAIDQYFLLNAKYPASLNDLIGPGKLRRYIHFVVGADYRTIDVSGVDLLRVAMADGTEILYSRATGTEVSAAPPSVKGR